MRLSTTLALLSAAFADAHYKFPSISANGVSTSDWQYVRKAANYQSNGPVTDVSSSAIRCYELAGRPAAQTLAVNAGSTVSFTVSASISHPGPMLFYMAKVPAGQTAASWDGSGNVWFKVYEETPALPAFTWSSAGATKVDVKLPASLPSGEYLLRAEHIALHSASGAGGAQFYIACAQVNVANGGNGSPGPLVSFPGAYQSTDPGIMINIYYPKPTSYSPPGPKVWSG